MDRDTYSKKYELLLAEYNEKPGYFCDAEKSVENIEAAYERILANKRAEYDLDDEPDFAGMTDEDRHREEERRAEAEHAAAQESWEIFINNADWGDLIVMESVRDRLYDAFRTIDNDLSGPLSADSAEELLEIVCDEDNDPPEVVATARIACEYIIDTRRYLVRLGGSPKDSAEEYRNAEDAEEGALNMARQMAERIAAMDPEDEVPEVETYGGPLNDEGWGACPPNCDGAFWPFIEVVVADSMHAICQALLR